ncbi:MAG: YigZ family protein, partial [Caulobacter sp.]|nr:YigZ family protein [Caulobacter sp.]
CWAWRLGQDYRSSDDGEPAGTAGRPILAAIDGQGYDRIAVVVARWFGGIKLGAGGLVRAYGGAAAECLRLATRQPLVAMAEIELACGFEDLGAVHAALATHAAEKTGERFEADGAHLSLRLPVAQIAALQVRLRGDGVVPAAVALEAARRLAELRDQRADLGVGDGGRHLRMRCHGERADQQPGQAAWPSPCAWPCQRRPAPRHAQVPRRAASQRWIAAGTSRWARLDT